MLKRYSSLVWRRLALAVLFGGLAPAAHAQLATYSFANSTGAEVTLPVDAQPANATFSEMSRGAGVTASNGANTFAAVDWSMGVLDATDYFSFTVTPAAGFQLQLDSLVLDERRSGTGIHDWSLRSSLDNFATDIITVNVPDDTNTRPKKITLPASFAGLTTAVEFRLYGYTAEATGGSWRIDNVRTFGAVTATGGGATPTISFGTATATVDESASTVAIPVTISAAPAQALSFDVVLATPAGTATDPTDYVFTTQTVTFAAGSTTPSTVNVSIVNDLVSEADETIIFSLQNINPANGGTLSTGTYTLTITDDDTPVGPVVTPIATLTVNDPAGVPAQNGTVVAARGTVYGVNTRTVGYQITLIDNTGGIGLFSSTDIGNPAVVLVEGDSIEVTGTLGQFNGLSQINLTNITMLGRAAILYQPRTVIGPLTEDEESELIHLAGPLTSVTPAQWTTTSTASGYNVDVTDGTNTYQVRVLKGTSLYNQPAPTGPFSLTGIGGQFDSSSPYTSGYQIAPRSITDLTVITANRTPAFASAVALFPNPAATHLTVRVGAEGRGAVVEVFNALGQRVSSSVATQEEVSLDVANLRTGMYHVRLTTKAGSVARSFVKE